MTSDSNADVARTRRRRVARHSHQSESNWLETAESVLCGSGGILLGVGFIFILLAKVIDPKAILLPGGRAAWIPTLALVIVFDGWLIANASKCIRERRFPLARQLELLHPNLPQWLRPVAAGVWLV